MKRLLLILAACLIALLGYNLYPEPRLAPEQRIDELRVVKSDHIMHAYWEGKLVASYRISLGANPVGHKVMEGDKRTPEGVYYINDRNPNSQYHRNLGVSYPNEDDLLAAKTGVDVGGDIKIHGLRNGLGFIGKFHRIMDWTAGCTAVTNEEMDELYNAVEPGAAITISQ